MQRNRLLTGGLADCEKRVIQLSKATQAHRTSRQERVRVQSEKVRTSQMSRFSRHSVKTWAASHCKHKHIEGGMCAQESSTLDCTAVGERLKLEALSQVECTSGCVQLTCCVEGRRVASPRRFERA